MRGLLKLRLLIRHGYSLIRPHLSWGGLVLPSLSTGPFHVIFLLAQNDYLFAVWWGVLGEANFLQRIAELLTLFEESHQLLAILFWLKADC
jgi:hypothetical protein